MTQFIDKQFTKMGARVKVGVENRRPDTRAWNGRVVRQVQPAPVRIDIRRDGKGEYFEVNHRRDVELQILDVQRHDRHLLLLARDAEDNKSKFLCGHDERAWFVAAIPESAKVRNVQDAKDALKPAEVWDSIRAHKLPARQRDRRWTKAFVRQGEWFFIPRPHLDVKLKGQVVLRNEPIRRGAGKPHVCQLMVRFGGQQVYVSNKYPNGLTVGEYEALDQGVRNSQRWRVMVRDAHVYVMGAIRHPDHATIWLSDWHEVVMNTETQAHAMRHVAFLD
jgi:hypothetical protein